MKEISNTSFIAKDYETILPGNPLFSGVNPEDISAMLLCLNAVIFSFEKKEVIIHEGNSADRVGIVIKGEASVLQDDIHGNRTLFRKLTSGDSFGETYACAFSHTFPMTVQSDSETTVLFLKTEQIFSHEHFCQFQGILIRNLLHIIAEENVSINRRLSNTMHKTTREKLLSFLYDESKRVQKDTFIISMDRQQLADYLGVERSALSAVISALTKEGILSSSRNTFTLHRKDSL